LKSLIKNKKELKLEKFDESNIVFEEILSFLYTGHCNINEKNFNGLMKYSDIFKLTVLKSGCFEHLIKLYCTEENVCKLLMDSKNGKYGYCDVEFLVIYKFFKKQ
jgi:hypothetical protein